MEEEVVNDDSENNVRCAVDNPITEEKLLLLLSDNEATSSVDRLKLPTINENQEGFHESTGCVRSLSLNQGKRRRRNSHPISAHDNTYHSPFSNESIAAGGRKDPMLAFDITRKAFVFKKHKLDIIEEADDLTEVAEQELVAKEQFKHQTSADESSFNPQRVRRSSFPTDINYVRQYQKLLM